MSLCKYSEIFGKPGEGVHQYRLFDVAIVDVIGTIVGAYILYLLFNGLFGFDTSYWVYLVLLFILAIVLHKLFCVKTTINKFLFGEK